MHSKAPSPLASHSIEGVPVRPAQLANLGLHADVAVGVGQQGLDGDEHLGQGEAGNPVALLDRVDANVTMPVDIGMEDLSEEPHLRRSEWIEHWNFKVEIEHPSLIGTAHRASD